MSYRLFSILASYPTLNIRYAELFKRLAKHLNVTIFTVSYRSKPIKAGLIRTIKVLPLGRPKRIITPLGGHIGSVLASALKPDAFWIIDSSFPESAYSFMRGAPLIVDVDDPILSLKGYLLRSSYERYRRERFLLVNTRVRKIIVPTQQIKDGLRKRLKIDEERITVIPNGVDINLFKPTPLPKNNTILYYGSFSYNRSEFLLKVIENVCRLSNDARFIIIGDIPHNFYEFVYSKGLKNRVKLVKRVRHEELPYWISKADVCILPQPISLGRGSSIKLLEYLSCGRPIVSTDVDESFPVRESGAGIIVPVDEEVMAKAILELLNDERLAKTLASNGIAYARKFDWDYIAMSYAKLIKRVIEGG